MRGGLDGFKANNFAVRNDGLWETIFYIINYVEGVMMSLKRGGEGKGILRIVASLNSRIVS